jgi:quercetin dioxygenase-like cupin family protein
MAEQEQRGPTVLVVDLDAEARALEHADERPRIARGLSRRGPLRVTLVSLAPGAGIEEHTAAGPITVQALRGELYFTAGGQEHRVRPGQLLTLAAGTPHTVHSEQGAAFLITLVQPEQ